MGVDFFPCDGCGESICDCGDFTSCKCGKSWCCLECAIESGCYLIDGEEDVDSCKYCRKEDLEDGELLNFLLKQYKLTRENAVKLYFEKNKKKGKKGKK